MKTMDVAGVSRILTINSGSSSIKCSLYHMGQIENSGASGRHRKESACTVGVFAFGMPVERRWVEEYRDMADHDEALKTLLGLAAKPISRSCPGRRGPSGGAWRDKI